MVSRLSIVVAVVFGALLESSFVLSQGENVTNGYVCEPKNPGGEETRLYFRQQDGVAINLSQSAAFPIVCPVVIPYQIPPYEAGLVFKNGSNATRRFNCALEEYDIFSNLVRSTGRGVNIPPGGTDLIAYENIMLLSDTNYLSLRCIIPPRGMVGWVSWF